ncbi:MAG: hypothetical protein U0359_04760 [Byssovorax sp.]
MSARRVMGVLLSFAVPALASQGCGGTVESGSTTGGTGGQCSTSPLVGTLTQSSIDKIDLLLAIDNSRSMADKQLILALTVPDLVSALVNPRCLDSMGVPSQSQPGGPLEPCPPGTRRAFTPILDLHIGVVDSSLGGHGSDACSTTQSQACGPAGDPSNDDAGHLLSRVDACGGQIVPTYKNAGFLAWDPAQKKAPPGEKNLGSIKIGDIQSDDIHQQVVTDTPGIVATLKDMVVGVGQVGCGYESQLEGWYRFLIDPEPYKTISVQGGKAVPSGVDDVLLEQRADFLRPSSLVAIVMLSDENDCSVKEYGQFFYAVQQRDPSDPKKSFRLPRARMECAANPADPCCKSCAQSAGDCPADPTCAQSPNLTDVEDDINLRCFDQKRRFGIDFLYPIDRYTTGLTSPTVPNRQGDLVQNPLFSDLDPGDGDSNVRDPSLVFLTGIVGVPWQDIARQDDNGLPNLLSGKDLAGQAVGGFKSATELALKDKNGVSTWDRILGDPANYVPPKDPHMIESVVPRAGLPPPGSPSDADPINGHEYSIPKNDDLQYACVFDLPAPHDCSNNQVACDCADPNNDSPLCDPNQKTIQKRAKGYPGLRELAVLRGLGGQGIVASVCPAQTSDPQKADYGYRPVIGSILDRLRVAISGQCLPHQLTPDPSGEVACVLVEARNSGGSCSCDPAAARRDVPAEHAGIVDVAKSSPLAKNAGWDCFCEIPQCGDPASSSPEELAACQGDASDVPVIQGGPDNGKNASGWCYVDPSAVPTSNPQIVQACPEMEKRIVRFVGNGSPGNNATVFVSCAISDCK